MMAYSHTVRDGQGLQEIHKDVNNGRVKMIVERDRAGQITGTYCGVTNTTRRPGRPSPERGNTSRRISG